MIGMYPDMKEERVYLFKDGENLNFIEFKNLRVAHQDFILAYEYLKSQQGHLENSITVQMDNGGQVDFDVFDLEDIVKQLDSLIKITSVN